MVNTERIHAQLSTEPFKDSVLIIEDRDNSLSRIVARYQDPQAEVKIDNDRQRWDFIGKVCLLAGAMSFGGFITSQAYQEELLKSGAFDQTQQEIINQQEQSSLNWGLGELAVSGTGAIISLYHIRKYQRYLKEVEFMRRRLTSQKAKV